MSNPLDQMAGFALMLLFYVPLLIAYLWSIVWAYRDARGRAKPPLLVALLVALLPPWPLGALIWYVFRPPHPFYVRPHSHYPVE